MSKFEVNDYFCGSCDLNLKVKKIFSYICPNCGGTLTPVDVKCDKQLDQYIENMDSEKIEEVKKKLSKLDEFLKKPLIKDIADNVKKLADVFKTSENNTAKVIAGAALLYLFSPIDFIPDIIPIIGFADDVAVIMLAMSKISQLVKDVDENYNINKKLKYQLSKQLFRVVSHESDYVYNYTENKDVRIWTLSASDAKKFNYRMLDSSIIKPQEVYIKHPYLLNVLVPVNNYDSILAESMIKEQLSLSSMLGAKTTSFKVKHYEKALKANKTKLGISSKKIDLDTDIKTYSSHSTEKEYVDEYPSYEGINYELIKDLSWYYTNEAALKDLIEQRIFRNIKKKKLFFSFKSENLLDVDTRLKLSSNNDLGIKVNFSNCIYRDIEAEIEFFDIPEEIEKNRDEVYKEIMEKIEKRRLELAI